MENGFFTALGTPVDKNGKLVASSMEKQVNDQIDAGASGLLCMGSMGLMVTVLNSEYRKVAEVCAKATNGRVPLIVGVMDCSCARVIERINMLEGLNIDGVVTTVPYYYTLSDEEVIRFYTTIADNSIYPLYLYDLAVVTQVAISENVAITLAKHPNIKGLKSANIKMIRDLMQKNLAPKDFDILYSGLDTMDVAISYGIKKNLDGMFACTPKNASLMYKSMKQGDSKTVSNCLDNIVKLRDLFVKHNVMPAFTHAMNLLGCEGMFHIDYEAAISNIGKEEIKHLLEEIGEINA